MSVTLGACVKQRACATCPHLCCIDPSNAEHPLQVCLLLRVYGCHSLKLEGPTGHCVDHQLTPSLVPGVRAIRQNLSCNACRSMQEQVPAHSLLMHMAHSTLMCNTGCMPAHSTLHRLASCTCASAAVLHAGPRCYSVCQHILLCWLRQPAVQQSGLGQLLAIACVPLQAALPTIQGQLQQFQAFAPQSQALQGCAGVQRHIVHHTCHPGGARLYADVQVHIGNSKRVRGVDTPTCGLNRCCHYGWLACSLVAAALMPSLQTTAQGAATAYAA